MQSDSTDACLVVTLPNGTLNCKVWEVAAAELSSALEDVKATYRAKAAR